jgi:hypothetical protein
MIYIDDTGIVRDEKELAKLKSDAKEHEAPVRTKTITDAHSGKTFQVPDHSESNRIAELEEVLRKAENVIPISPETMSLLDKIRTILHQSPS